MSIQKKVLVTGATGFWGQHLLLLLRKIPDIELISMGCYGAASVDIVGDISSKGAWQEEVSKLSISHVIHLAGLTRSENTIHLYNTHILGLANLLDTFDKRKPWFLLVSSGAVYGITENSSLPISEDHGTAPITAYGKSKLEQELYLNENSTQLNGLCLVRPSNLIGPGLSDDFFLGKVVHQIRILSLSTNLAPVLKMGSLSVTRDFLDVRDAALAISTLLDKEVTGLFNLSSAKEYKLRDIVAECIQRVGLSISIMEDETIFPHPVKRQSLDNRKIISETVWTPKYSLSQTIEDMYYFVSTEI